MHHAEITTWGAAPKYTTTPDLPVPDQDSGDVLINVEAVGIHRVVRSRASGSHYTASSLPHVPGIDGAGTTVPSGEKVYFSTFATGVMAERIILPRTAVIPLPPDVDAVNVAASVNPAVASWMALKARTAGAPPSGATVLIVGVTSASGRIAVAVARALGAGKIIGAARAGAKLDGVEGLDERVILRDPVTETDWGTAVNDVDVVLDFVYGDVALNLWKSLKTPKPVQYVHVGALSGQMEVQVPGAVLRSKDITIRGSGPGAWRMGELVKTLPQLLDVVAKAPKLDVKVAKFEDVEKEWDYDGPARLVFVP